MYEQIGKTYNLIGNDTKNVIVDREIRSAVCRLHQQHHLSWLKEMRDGYMSTRHEVPPEQEKCIQHMVRLSLGRDVCYLLSVYVRLKLIVVVRG